MLIFASCLCLLSCSSDDNEPSINLTLSDVIGLWNVTEMTENGKTNAIPSGQVTIDLDNDNSYQVKFFSNTYIGTYHLSENTIIGTTLDPITERFKFTKFDGTNATIQYSNSVGDKYIFKATKKTYARVSLNYTFAESGNMSRTTGDDAYSNFYNKFINTRILTPTTYSLTFTNQETGATATINGRWDKKDAIRLVEGEYLVTGTSIPIHNKFKGEPSDTAYLSFNETINITKDMSSLLLQAKYDSYLLMFDAGNIKDIYYNHAYANGYNYVTHYLYDAETIFTLFVRDLEYSSADFSHSIYLTRNDGKKTTITLNEFPFEKGKYYYFNDMTNSFDIPPMESGN